MGTLTIECKGCMNKQLFDKAVQNILWDKNTKNSNGNVMEILRLKVCMILIKNLLILLSPLQYSVGDIEKTRLLSFNLSYIISTLTSIYVEGLYQQCLVWV